MQTLSERMGPNPIQHLSNPPAELFAYLKKWSNCPTVAYAAITSTRNLFIRSTCTVFGHGPDSLTHNNIPVGTSNAFEIIWSFKIMRFEINAASNGVRLNNVPIQSSVITDGDHVSFGTWSGTFVYPTEDLSGENKLIRNASVASETIEVAIKTTAKPKKLMPIKTQRRSSRAAGLDVPELQGEVQQINQTDNISKSSVRLKENIKTSKSPFRSSIKKALQSPYRLDPTKENFGSPVREDQIKEDLSPARNEPVCFGKENEMNDIGQSARKQARIEQFDE